MNDHKPVKPLQWSPWKWLNGREIRSSTWAAAAEKDVFYRQLYSSFQGNNNWHSTKYSHDETLRHGGIFNFDFSMDGGLLVAACERKSILVFDPLNKQLLNVKEDAHQDCVNCVRFLDNRTFATCSDDTTIRLWDARFLASSVSVLRGHSNWVKNVEYSSKDGLLVTSGFDGSIYTWDINKYNDKGNATFKRVFHSHGLMRSKLTPDASKLVIATCDGYLLVIHDLDLNHLADDFHGFKPNMYHMMLTTDEPVRQWYSFKHLFNAKRNRVELITDFPEKNDAEMISALQVHPQGWCVLSRNVSSDEDSEWTCVHDIQSKEEKGQLDESVSQPSADSEDNDTDLSPTDIETDQNSGGVNPGDRSLDYLVSAADWSSSESDDSGSQDSELLSETESQENSYVNISRLIMNQNDIQQSSVCTRAKYSESRLLYYIEEPNVGRGYIKELCFSSDGRLIISPFGFGVRILSFNPDCQELCDCPLSQITSGLNLYELTSNMSHSSVVVTTKFSPTHPLFVSGCLDGKVSFHSPVF